MGIPTQPNRRRNYAIFRQHKRGVPVRKLAVKYNLSTQRIYKIIEWARNSPDPKAKLPIDNTIAE